MLNRWDTHRGGSIIELDIRRAAWNVVGTMAPYEEAYHRQIEESEASGDGDDATRSIHDGLVLKERGLERLARGAG